MYLVRIYLQARKKGDILVIYQPGSQQPKRGSEYKSGNEPTEASVP